MEESVFEEYVQCISDIEQLLLKAHTKSGYIEKVLEKTARILKAQNAFLVIFNKNSEFELHVWHDAHSKINEIPEERVREALEQIAYPPGTAYISNDEVLDPFRGKGVDNALITPLEGPDGTQIGTLGISNLENSEEDFKLMKWITGCFSLGITSLLNHRKILAMNTTDELTGLLNADS